MKQLVITGSSGFVGRRLVEVALSRGFAVIGVDLASTESLRCKQFALNLNSENIAHLIPEGATVIHLASLSTDSQCRQNPTLALESNLAATLKVLLSSTEAKAAQFVFASSEWVYPEIVEETLQYESDLLSLTSLESMYAISKLVGESVIRVTSEIPYWLLRFGIVYGPRNSPGSAPESLAYKVSQGECIEVGSFDTSRRFIFIDDLVDGILAAVDAGPSLASPDPINIAGRELVSLRKTLETAGEILNLPIDCSEAGNLPSIRNPDISRAKEILGWEPKVSFGKGLSECLSKMQALQRESEK